MEEIWYFGDIIENSSRVLLKQLGEEDYQLYKLNRIDHRDYTLEETERMYNSSQLKNMELIYNGELIPIIVDHLGMLLDFQTSTGHYRKDDDKVLRK